MSLLDVLFRKRFAVNGGAPVSPERVNVNIIAPGATIADDPVGKQTDLVLGTSSSWIAFTPTLQTTGSNFVLGNGTVLGRYRFSGFDKQIHIELLGGNTTAIGTGNLIFDLHGDVADPAQLTSSESVPLEVYIFDGTQAHRQAGYATRAVWATNQMRGPDVSDLTSLTGGGVNGVLYGFSFAFPVG